MIIAGYENTGNSMSFLAYNFAFHQDAQVKAQMEIDNYLKNGVSCAYALTFDIGSGVAGDQLRK